MQSTQELRVGQSFAVGGVTVSLIDACFLQQGDASPSFAAKITTDGGETSHEVPVGQSFTSGSATVTVTHAGVFQQGDEPQSFFATLHVDVQA
jgi:hypothetical protein